MFVEFGEKRKYQYEYSFYMAIRDFNEMAGVMGAQPIMTTEARQLHQRMLDFIGEMSESQGRPIDMAGGSRANALYPDEFRAAANAALAERMGTAPFADDAALRTYSEQFVRATGMMQNEHEVSGDGYYLPISPFDERFANREFAWSNGSALSWVHMDDVERLSDVGRGWEELAAQAAAPGGPSFTAGNLNMNVPIYRCRDTEDGPVYERGDDGRGYGYGHLVSAADLSGAQALRPYLRSEREFREVSRHASAPFEAYRTRGSYENQRTGTQVGFARAVADAQRNAAAGAAVLRMLAMSGREFEVTPDLYEGQLKVEDKVSRMQMRLLDAPGNAPFAGRIWDKGAGVAYFTQLSVTETAGDSVRQAPMPRSAYTPEMATSAFAWACGMPDPNGRRVGFADDWMQSRGRTVHGSFYAAGSGVNVALGRLDGYRARAGAAPEEVFVQMRANYSGYNVGYESFNGAAGAERARAYVEDVIVGARGVLEDMIGLDALVDEAREFGAVDGYIPDFELGGSIPDEVADVRADLWAYLTDTNRTLLDPGVDRSSLETVEDVMANSLSHGDGSLQSRADAARAWVTMYSDLHVGTLSPGDDGTWLDVNGAACYAAEGSEMQVRENLVSALRTLELGPEVLKGSSRSSEAADSLRRFCEDGEEPIPLSEMPDGVQRMAMEAVRDSLRRNMCEVDDDGIVIDSHGIIEYVAMRSRGATAEAGMAPSQIVGQVGPVFEKGAHGAYETDFAGTENYDFVPSLAGFALPADAAPGDFWQRVRAISFEDRLVDAVSAQVAHDVRRAKDSWDYTGRPDSLRRMWNIGDYAVKFGMERFETFAEMETDQEWLRRFDDARVETEARRVSFGSDVSREASTLEHYRRNDATIDGFAYAKDEGERFNDNGGDLYRHMGSQDWSSLPSYVDSVFAVDRAGSAGNTHTKYVEGELFRDRPPEPKAAGYVLPIFSEELGLYDERAFDSVPRRWMGSQNGADCLGVTEPCGTAMCGLEGWVDEDSAAVSLRFAEAYRVPDGRGGHRPLAPGDKISDSHGNKKTVSVVIDPSMGAEDAKALGIEGPVELFAKNLSLDVVVDSAATLSRNNAGTLREAIGSEVKDDLVLPERTVAGLAELGRDVSHVPDGIAQMRFIVHDKTAEKKTNLDAVPKFGWQESMLMKALGAEALARDGYDGGRSLAAGRERLSEVLRCAYGAGVDGNRFELHSDGPRRRMPAPNDSALLERAVKLRKDGEYSSTNELKKRMRDAFVNQLSHFGGEMELPFPLEFPKLSVDAAELPAGVLRDDEGVEVRERGGKETFSMSIGGFELAQSEVGPDGPDGSRNGTWVLPVLSKTLRESFTRDSDGRTVHSNLTGKYGQVYAAVLDWKEADARMKALGFGDDARMAELQRDKDRAQAKAQRQLDSLASEMTDLYFKGKHNIGKDSMFTGRLRNGAVSIMSADPRLGVSKVGMSPALAAELGVGDGDEVVVRRHPVLKPGHVMCLEVSVDDRLPAGTALDPALVHMLGGDFDGDQMVVSVPTSAEARAEAHALLHPLEFICDHGCDPARQEEGLRPLNLGLGGDVAVGIADKAWSDVDLTELTRMANAYAADRSSMSVEELEVRRAELTGKLDDFLAEMRGGTAGKAALELTDAASVTRSIYDEVVDRKVKGSPAKFAAEWMPAMGVHAEMTEGKGPDMSTFEDFGHTLVTRSDEAGTMVATALKQMYTGHPGKEMQKVGAGLAAEGGAEANASMLSGLRLVEKLYQCTLDWKHYGAKAIEQRSFIDCAKNILAGYVVDIDGEGSVVRDEEGEPVRADGKTFARQVAWCWGDKLGQDFDPADVRALAAEMSARGENGLVAGAGELVSQADFVSRMAFTEDPSAVVEAVLRGDECVAGPFFGSYASVESRADEAAMRAAERDAFDFDRERHGVQSEHAPADVRDAERARTQRGTRMQVAARTDEGEVVASMSEVFNRPKPGAAKPTADSVERAAEKAMEKAARKEALERAREGKEAI